MEERRDAGRDTWLTLGRGATRSTVGDAPPSLMKFTDGNGAPLTSKLIHLPSPRLLAFLTAGLRAFGVSRST